jgi:hypothetical protein
MGFVAGLSALALFGCAGADHSLVDVELVEDDGSRWASCASSDCADDGQALERATESATPGAADPPLARDAPNDGSPSELEPWSNDMPLPHPEMASGASVLTSERRQRLRIRLEPNAAPDGDVGLVSEPRQEL